MFHEFEAFSLNRFRTETGRAMSTYGFTKDEIRRREKEDQELAELERAAGDRVLQIYRDSGYLETIHRAYLRCSAHELLLESQKRFIKKLIEPMSNVQAKIAFLSDHTLDPDDNPGGAAFRAVLIEVLEEVA